MSFFFILNLSSSYFTPQALLWAQSKVQPDVGWSKASSPTHRGDDPHDQARIRRLPQGAREDQRRNPREAAEGQGRHKPPGKPRPRGGLRVSGSWSTIFRGWEERISERVVSFSSTSSNIIFLIWFWFQVVLILKTFGINSCCKSMCQRSDRRGRFLFSRFLFCPFLISRQFYHFSIFLLDGSNCEG